MRGKDIVDDDYYNSNDTVVTSTRAFVHPVSPAPIRASDNSYDTCDYYTHYLAALCLFLCVMLCFVTAYAFYATKRRVRYYGVPRSRDNIE